MAEDREAGLEVVEVTAGSAPHAAQLTLRGRWLREPLGLAPATARHPREDEARHFVARDAGGDVVGCVSLLDLGGGQGKLLQMVVEPALRGRGVGRRLVRRLEAAARDAGLGEVVMHARCAAIPFYERLGYAAEGPVFAEVSVPHRVMRRQLG